MNRIRRPAISVAVATLMAVGGFATSAGAATNCTNPDGQCASSGPAGAGNRVARGSSSRAGKKSAKARAKTGQRNQQRIPATTGTISSAVAEQLQYLIEEEKLAGDIYDLASSLYGDRVFANIAAAEDAHAAAVRTLLGRYQIADPTRGMAAGSFKNSELQDLYATLAAQVKSSRTAALEAGVAIEKADIADLEKLLKTALPADAKGVATNLLRGSRQHLVAFQRQLG